MTDSVGRSDWTKELQVSVMTTLTTLVVVLRTRVRKVPRVAVVAQACKT
jgi:hypothetical protein